MDNLPFSSRLSTHVLQTAEEMFSGFSSLLLTH